MRTVPETANRTDWPRLVAAEVNANGRALNAAEANIATLQTSVTAAQGNITTLQGNVTALQTATNWGLLADYADDAAAAVGGVAVGALYRTGSIVKVRVS